MITHSTSTNTNDGVLNGSFQRVAESHVEYTITQNHVDVRKEKKPSESFMKIQFFFLRLSVNLFLKV